MSQFRIQPRIAVGDAVDNRHAIVLHQRQSDAFDHVVEPGTESAGGQNRRLAPGRIVENPLPRTGFFERIDFSAVHLIVGTQTGEFAVEKNLRIGRNKAGVGIERGFKITRTEFSYGEHVRSDEVVFHGWRLWLDIDSTVYFSD